MLHYPFRTLLLDSDTAAGGQEIMHCTKVTPVVVDDGPCAAAAPSWASAFATIATVALFSATS